MDTKAAFIPLTVDAAGDLDARLLLRQALVTENAAKACWTALLADCDSQARWGLGKQLRRLSEATSMQVGTRWWFAAGAGHRLRVAATQEQIEEAIADGDGQEFALAFVGYDHAMASAVVCADTERHRRPVGDYTA